MSALIKFTWKTINETKNYLYIYKDVRKYNIEIEFIYSDNSV